MVLAQFLSMPIEITWLIGLIFGVLISATVFFRLWGLLKPQHPDIRELQIRTRSWWIMSVVFVSSIVLHPLVSFFGLAFLSFATLREFYSVVRLRPADRQAIWWAYLAIPIQYTLAYVGWMGAFLTFIPVVMFIWLPFVLVLQGNAQDIGKSMAVIPTSLMIGLFGLSHMALLLGLPELEGFAPGGKGLLLFLVFLTEINDVYQFIWGKLFGKRRILPRISPNKTWEGLIGGLISTTLTGYLLAFLTPLSTWEVLGVSFCLSLVGFMGDVIISGVKRDIGIKDTGRSIPGHGGILDRVDSLTATSPVFFHLVYALAYSHL